MSQQQHNVSPQRIVDMANAFHASCVLFSASDLGIFDCVAENEPVAVERVAVLCGLDLRATRLLLDACAAVGLLRKDGARYRVTEETRVFLLDRSPVSLTKALRYNRDVYSAWGRLSELVRTGEPVESPELHLGKDAQRTRDFVLSMHSRALGIGRAVVPLLDLSGKRRLLDLAGGPGTYSVLMAQANPKLACTVVDLPGIVAVAAELIAEAGMGERVACVPGSYHELEFAAEYDAVNIFGALHQESADGARRILTRAFAALVPGGCIYVLDMMTDATHAHPRFSALFAVNMALTTTNGWVFSDEELRFWLEEAGFVDCACRPLPPPMPHWLMTARKPGLAE